MTRKAVVTLVAVALWGGGFVSEATATPGSVHPPGKLCNPNVCSEEVAAACPGLRANAFNRCRKDLIANCRSGLCTCTGDPTLPACGPTPTTTNTAPPTTTTGAVTTTTGAATTTTGAVTTTTGAATTTTTEAPIQCCLPGSPSGSCVLETATQCSSAGGANLGPGTCSPNPCGGATTTTTG